MKNSVGNVVSRAAKQKQIGVPAEAGSLKYAPLRTVSDPISAKKKVLQAHRNCRKMDGRRRKRPINAIGDEVGITLRHVNE